MTQQGHQELTGSALTAAAKATLARSGERWTETRADIFEALSDFDTPVSAYDIAEKVGEKRGKRIAPNSVYRILDLFVANNLAKRVEMANAYVVNSHPGCRHDCLFLLCNECGRLEHIDDDTLSGRLRETANAAGFTEIAPSVEARGLCSKCSTAG